MTTAPTTGDHLLRAIAANPDEDAPRLLYADYLEELPAVRVRCPQCGGSKCPHCDGPDRDYHTLCHDCPACDGAGEVLDTGNRDRAEFIREQVQLGPNYPEDRCYCGHSDCDRCPLQWRTAALQQNHPDWSRLPCPACSDAKRKMLHWAGDGRLYGAERLCPTCHGVGNLLKRWDEPYARIQPRDPVFRRGFIDSVSCTLAEAFAPDGTPTPWARAVCEMLPLTRLVISDRTTGNADTDAGAGPFGGRVWWCDNYRTWPNPPHQLPVLLFDAIDAPAEMGDAGKNPPRVKVFPTRAAATDALARAACRAVRAAGSTGAA